MKFQSSNEVLDMSLRDNYVLRSFKVTEGQKLQKCVKKGKSSIFSQVVKENVPMKIVRWVLKIIILRGHLRSPKVNNSRNRSKGQIFQFYRKYWKETPRWSSWNETKRRKCLVVIQGHWRSKIMPKSKNFIFLS